MQQDGGLCLWRTFQISQAGSVRLQQREPINTSRSAPALAGGARSLRVLIRQNAATKAKSRPRSLIRFPHSTSPSFPDAESHLLVLTVHLHLAPLPHRVDWKLPAHLRVINDHIHPMSKRVKIILQEQRCWPVHSVGLGAGGDYASVRSVQGAQVTISTNTSGLQPGVLLKNREVLIRIRKAKT